MACAYCLTAAYERARKRHLTREQINNLANACWFEMDYVPSAFRIRQSRFYRIRKIWILLYDCERSHLLQALKYGVENFDNRWVDARILLVRLWSF